MNLDTNIETVFKVELPVNSVENGFGYIGVLLRNKDTDLIQCHLCGRWFNSLSQHIFSSHKIPVIDYKKKFGLPLSFPLISRSLSSKHHQRAMTPKNIEHLKNIRSKTGKLVSTCKRKKFMKYATNCEAYKNKFGLCDEQILRRYLMVTDIVGAEVGMRTLKKYDPALEGAINRRGGISEFKKKNGFTVIKKHPIRNDDEILSIIRKEYKTIGHVPTSKHFKRPGSISLKTIINRFGSYRRALEMAGLFSNGQSCSGEL